MGYNSRLSTLLGMKENVMVTPKDNPGVIGRPPLLYLGALVIVLVLRWFWRMPIFGHGIALWPGLALVATGVGIAAWGRKTLQAAGTNVNPALPTTAIVTSGPFRFSRNPLYLSLTLIFCGLTLAFNTWWGVAMLLPLLGIMHCGVVLREERYLDQKFGETYRQYRSNVRRYF